MTTPTPRRFPLLGKTVAIAAVFIAVTLALQAVSGIVAERESRLREAERSVAASLAASQTLVGPMLLRECTEQWETTQGEGKERKVVTEVSRWYLSESPKTLDVTAAATLEPRYRGIFKVNGYVLKARLAATWADGSGLAAQGRHPGALLSCDAPVLYVALGDSRGVRSAQVRIDGASAPVLPGTRHAAHRNGFHVDVAESWAGAQKPMSADITLELVGTGGLDIAPVGEATQVSLESDWPHPSFTGRFLPVERVVTADGFSATWKLNALATTAPAEASLGVAACGTEYVDELTPKSARSGRCLETFGVDFIDPVSPYTLSDRATKYGLLFIALTFVGVGAVEVMRRVRVHPIQYLMVGAALSIFFLLLVSLSEHVAFGVAYSAASAACTLLITFYGMFVLGGARAGALFGVGIAALFGALYLLLQLEQTALLIGSVMLFGVLAAVMIATRRVDWYALFASMRSDRREPSAVPGVPVADAGAVA